MSKRGASAIHFDSAPPPKKRKINEIESNRNESSVTPDAQQGRFKPGQIVYEDNDFQFEFLYNDQEENHLIALTDLKQIFAACLPRMGTRYVTRHVFDEHHRLICCRSKIAHTLNNGNSNNNRSGINELNITYPVKYPAIGGICIRPFYQQHFGEVVFLAVHNSHQHKSVGRKIMRVMKHVAIQENLHHFYTYADNQAIGFFQKMGFIKKRGTQHHHIRHHHGLMSMGSGGNNNGKQKEPFWDYIKHYTGSELMECKLYNKVDYIKLDENLRKIEQDILFQCQSHRKAQYVQDFEREYSPIPQFLIPINKLIVILDLDDNFNNEQDDELLIETLETNGIYNDRDLYDVFNKINNKRIDLKQLLCDTFDKRRGDEIYSKFVTYLTKPNDKKVSNHIEIKIDEIEGVKEEWNYLHESNDHSNCKDLNKRRSSRFFPVRMKAKWMLKKVMKNDDAYPFNDPVPKTVPGYYERIKYPMDMKTMQEKNDRGEYNEWKEFDKDFKLMIQNCKDFNEPASEIVKMSTRLSEYYQQCLIKYDRTMADKKGNRK